MVLIGFQILSSFIITEQGEAWLYFSFVFYGENNWIHFYFFLVDPLVLTRLTIIIITSCVTSLTCCDDWPYLLNFSLDHEIFLPAGTFKSRITPMKCVHFNINQEKKTAYSYHPIKSHTQVIFWCHWKLQHSWNSNWNLLCLGRSN